MARKKNKPEKLRVQFQKNRTERARIQNLTRQAQDETDSGLDKLAAGERISGKGEVARYRTVIGERDARSGEVLLAIDESSCVPGRVLSCIGINHSLVELPDGQRINCAVRRIVRTLNRDNRNAVVAGDRVQVSLSGPGTGVIERVEPRSSTLSRGSRRQAHVIVANVDQAVIVTSANEPPLKPALIDRFLCSTEKGQIRGIICINKLDLGNRIELQPLIGQYSRIGYQVVLTNALTGEGIDELRQHLIGRETVFTGQSGVGKTSLLNAVQPGLGRATREVSEDSRKGQHTTRVAELLPLQIAGASAAAGWVVDTPGIRQLQLWDIQPEEVEGLFIEFRPFVALCRFADCRHLDEPDCGVKLGLSQGMLSPLRYESYVRIVTGDEDSLFSFADWRRRKT